MGGFGSGRRVDGKRTVESCRRIDVRELYRSGHLTTTGWRGCWSWLRNGEKVASVGLEASATAVTLDYKANGEPQRYAVMIEWTPCTYGGRRPWFRCPGASCGRRCAVLYGGRIFACRNCHRLAYESQRELRCWRMQRKAEKIRARLGIEWKSALVKPSRMHWRTFERLVTTVNQADYGSLLGLIELGRRLGIR